MSWKSETDDDLAPVHMMRTLFGPKQYGQGEGRCPEEVASASEGYVRSLGREPGWPVVTTLAPVGAAARIWVETWSSAVAAISVRAGDTEAIERKQKLEEQRDDAIGASRWDRPMLPRARPKYRRIAGGSWTLGR
jgi:hypothetical protein